MDLKMPYPPFYPPFEGVEPFEREGGYHPAVHKPVTVFGVVALDSNRATYPPFEGVEPFERYRPGGYHPAVIGDQLNDRYYIVHKLGFGTNSITWLARDQKTATYVAVKVLVAHREQAESDILRLLKSNPRETHPGSGIIPLLLDEFDINGPNGKHRCIVTTPARVSIAYAQDASINHLFQPSVARAIIAQLIQAVAFLHSMGIVHSDLHPGNILLCLPNSINNLTPDQLYEKYSQPNPEPVQRLDQKPLGDGVPMHAIMPIWLGEDSEKIPFPEARIMLIDFSESFMPSITKRYHSSTPVPSRPPEPYFLPEAPISFPADIWTLVCTIFSILGQRPLFDVFLPHQERVIAEHVDILGKLPPDWWNRWRSRDKWFDVHGERKDGRSRGSWEKQFEFTVQKPRRDYGMEEVSEEEKIALFAMLKPMMAYNPQERPTAQQILESEWMDKWALPDLRDMQEGGRSV